MSGNQQLIVSVHAEASAPCDSAEAPADSSRHAARSDVTPAQALLDSLKRDGFLSAEDAALAADKYAELLHVAPRTGGVFTSAAAKMRPYATASNGIKLFAAVFLLYAFSGVINKLAIATWWIIEKVPVEIYQGVLLSGTLVGTIMPAAVFRFLLPSRWQLPGNSPHPTWLGIFCSVANIIVSSWVVNSHASLKTAWDSLTHGFGGGDAVGGFLVYGLIALYSSVLALYHSTHVLGVPAVFCTGAALTALLIHAPERLGAFMPGVAGFAAITVPFLVLRAYSQLPKKLALFNEGVDYVSVPILGGALFLSTCSVFPGAECDETSFFLGFVYTLALVACNTLAVLGFLRLPRGGHLRAAAVIFTGWTALFVLTLVCSTAFQFGTIIGAFVTGVALYGGSVVLDRYGKKLLSLEAAGERSVGQSGDSATSTLTDLPSERV